MYSAESLNKLKVNDLKTICKQLKAPNFSKLNKAALVKLIIDRQSSNADRCAAPLSEPPPQQDANLVPQLQKPVTQEEHTSSEQKRQKKRKAELTLEKENPPDTDTQVLIKPSQTSVKASENGISRLSETKNPVTAEKQQSVPVKPKIPSCTLKPSSSTLKAASSTLQTTSITPKTASSALETPSYTLKPTSSISPIVSKTRTKKVFRGLQPVNNPPSNVRGLASAHATYPLTPMNRLTSETDRTDFIRTHFLEDLFLNLNANRVRPITEPPFPTASEKRCSSAQAVSKLAFQGLSPSIYRDTIPQEAFIVAVRFWLSRFHTLMQLGSGEAWSFHGGGVGLLNSDLSKWPSITCCRQISQDFWLIETEGSDSNGPTRYLTVGLNGDVISSSQNKSEDNTIEGCPVRKDWYSFILANPTTPHPSISTLFEHVKTKNLAEYPNGIARCWKERITARLDAVELLRVAERTVLASCVLNSFTGSKMSATEMDAQNLGYEPLSCDGKSTRIELYLPESSQVLSVLFRKKPFHQALASVTRHNGNTDYVLAETGQIVGTEEEGVSLLWQGLLGCDERGDENNTRMGEFWNGWEARMSE